MEAPCFILVQRRGNSFGQEITSTVARGFNAANQHSLRVLQSRAGLSFLCIDLIYLKILLYGCCPADKAKGQQ